MKRIIVSLILISLLGVGCGQMVNQPKDIVQELPSDKMILFVGKDCPHCEVVENKLSDDYKSTPIDIKEVFNDNQNANLLVQALRVCGQSLDSAGVPLLWNGRGCYQGDEDVLNYLKSYKENNSK